MTLSTIATLTFIMVDANTSDWAIRAMMLVRGGAFGLALVPMQAATFAEVSSKETGHASAAFSVIRQVASSFGVALIATVLTARLAAHGAIMGDPGTRDGAIIAFHDAFVAASIMTALAIGAAFMMSDKLAAGTMQPKATPTTEITVDDEIALAAD